MDPVKWPGRFLDSAHWLICKWQEQKQLMWCTVKMDYDTVMHGIWLDCRTFKTSHREERELGAIPGAFNNHDTTHLSAVRVNDLRQYVRSICSHLSL